MLKFKVSQSSIRFSQMQFQKILHSIIIIISVAISIRLISAQQDDHHQQQFLNCSNRFFSCGPSIRDVGYPFWGGDRPRECGDHLFELRCAPENRTTTIDIDGGAFLVYSINTTNNSMRLARLDLLDDICPDRFETTRLDLDPLLRYTPQVEDVMLLYGCPPPNGSEWDRFSFGCAINGENRTGYFMDGSFLRVQMIRDMTRDCESNITVPVLSSALEEYSTKETTIDIVLRRGFEVEYQVDCTTCERSGGLCWSTNANATCLCRDGLRRSVCPDSGSNPWNSSSPWWIVVGIVLGVTSLVIVSTIIYCFLKRRSLPIVRYKETNQDVENFLLQQAGSLVPKGYRYSEIKKITKSFSDKLGHGGYGSVYKGILPDGCLVAVKVLVEMDSNGEDFINEVASISRTSHVNIVNLLGFCFDRNKRALVYEFMPNKSLDKFISKNNSDCQVLDQEKMYEIAVGVAKGLEYLHSGCNTRIVHFDIKPQNILLDQDFRPKISDFGLAKLCKKKQSILSMLGTRGTIGYIAPEVFSRNFGQVSHKSDVYSFGMMILEMAGARNMEEDETTDSSTENYFPDKIYEQVVLNPIESLDDPIVEEKARKMLLVGFWCIQTTPSDRPPMSKVVDMLEGSIRSIQIPPKPLLFCHNTLSLQENSPSLSEYVETENTSEDIVEA